MTNAEGKNEVLKLHHSKFLVRHSTFNCEFDFDLMMMSKDLLNAKERKRLWTFKRFSSSVRD